MNETKSTLNKDLNILSQDKVDFCCDSIINASILLLLPRSIANDALIFFHRYFYRKKDSSFTPIVCVFENFIILSFFVIFYIFKTVAMASLFLSCKNKESERNPSDIVNAFMTYEQKREGKPKELLPLYSSV